MKKVMGTLTLLLLATLIAAVSTSCWPPEETQASNPCSVAKQVKDSIIKANDKFMQ